MKHHNAARNQVFANLDAQRFAAEQAARPMADELQQLFDAAMSAKESADMYTLMGYPAIAAEYQARANAYAREWRELNADVSRS